MASLRCRGSGQTLSLAVRQAHRGMDVNQLIPPQKSTGLGISVYLRADLSTGPAKWQSTPANVDGGWNATCVSCQVLIRHANQYHSSGLEGCRLCPTSVQSAGLPLAASSPYCPSPFPGRSPFPPLLPAWPVLIAVTDFAQVRHLDQGHQSSMAAANSTSLTGMIRRWQRS